MDMLSTGDRVQVKGEPHEPGQDAGTVALVNPGPAYGIRFDGMADDDGPAVHKWYVGDELTALDPEDGGGDGMGQKGAAGGQMKGRGARSASTVSGTAVRTDFTRSVAFRAEPSGDGRTFTGYAAVYNSVTRINSAYEGNFDEQVAPGAFARYLRDNRPVLMFEHGSHPLIGSMPLGVIERTSEDSTGLHVEARLSDNWLVQPVRDAVADGAVTGMSFRFKVPKGGDRWERRAGDVDLRTLIDVDIPELGPVVFPAYAPTTASVRSALDHLTDLTGRPDAERVGGGGSKDSEPVRALARARSLARHRELILRGIISG